MKRTSAKPPASAWSGRRPVPCCQLGVLHAFGPGYLHATNHQLQFTGSADRRLRIPLRDLALVALYGPVRVTAGAVRLATDAGAALAYFSADGRRCNGTLQPAADAWRGRRYRQFRALHDRAGMLAQARTLVGEKLASMAEALAAMRHQGRCDGRLRGVLARLRDLRRAVAEAPDHAALRGLEGTAARDWFAAMNVLLPPGWSLPGRSKRPPTDPVNALLSLGYVILYQRAQAACWAWGLDPALGCLHEYRPGRASLACDLIEPFRVPAVDRLVLRQLARGRFAPDDFATDPATGAVRLGSDDAFRRYLGDLEDHWHEASPESPSLQTRLIEQARRHAETLPAWDGRWPNSLEPNEFLPVEPMPADPSDDFSHHDAHSPNP